METLILLHKFINFLWKHMKETISCKTEDEWEKCMESQKIFLEEINKESQEVGDLAASCFASWVIFVEKRNMKS